MNNSLGSCDFQEVLTDIGPFLPLSFAVWKSGYDEVFVSEKLRAILSVKQNIVDAYSFVKSMQKVFGTIDEGALCSNFKQIRLMLRCTRTK